MFFALFSRERGWRIYVDYTSIGGDVIDICGAADEYVARTTADMMNQAKQGA